MMLKIKTDTGGWWVLDNVESVSYMNGVNAYYEDDIDESDQPCIKLYSNSMLHQEEIKEPPDFNFIDMTTRRINDSLIPCKYIIITMMDGTKKTVVFSHVAYLLNNNGRTIDKL